STPLRWLPEQSVVLGEVALDRREIESLQDRVGRFAIEEKFETSQYQVLNVAGLGSARPAISVCFLHGDEIRGSVAALLDRAQAPPAVARRLHAHSYHRVSS